MRSSNLAYAIRYEVAEQQNEKPSIKKLPVSRAVKQKKHFRQTMMGVAYIVMLSAALIYGKVKLTEENAMLAEATTTYQELQSEYAQLEVSTNNMASLKVIEDQARALGLGEINAAQIENIIVASDNEVEVSQNDTGVFSWWDDLLAYIFG